MDLAVLKKVTSAITCSSVRKLLPSGLLSKTVRIRINEPILPLLLNQRETCSLTWREEGKLQTSDNMALRNYLDLRTTK